MTYRSVIPQVFPWRVTIPDGQLAIALAILCATDSRCPQGSSFAVTSTAGQGHRHLWMSDASLRRLTDRGLAEGARRLETD